MNAQYRHSQPGYLMIVTAVISLVVTSFVYAYGQWPLWMPIGAIGVFILVSGYKLTVKINDGFLKFWFGPGIFWKTIPLEKIAYCEPFKGVIFGWGIHAGSGGWLYNVSGMKAVTVVLRSGKKMYIGTDEPKRLVEAVNSAIHGFGDNEVSLMWAEVKTDYLNRVEQALSAVRHPRSFEILADVSSHLDSRFAELGLQQQTWENFQNITTEMGPPSEYAELIGQAQPPDEKGLSAGFLIALVLILTAVAVGMIVLPKILKRNVIFPTNQEDSQVQREQAVASAIEAAKSWLQLADDGAYSESWARAAEYFRKYVSEDQWKISLGAVRKPLGKILSRKVINGAYTTSLPGAPVGQYVVIQFEASFENKHSAVETVTPMMESDGQWRVSGYYIK